MIKIQTEELNFVLKTDGEESSRLFWRLVSGLVPPEQKTRVEAVPEAEKPITERVESVSKCVESVPKCVESVPEEQEDETQLYKYRGFQYIKCKHCGQVKGFSTKEELSWYKCKKCGEITQYTEPLDVINVECECGRHFFYHTNMSENKFDINCIECGNPVSVEYNIKKNSYVTIK